MHPSDILEHYRIRELDKMFKIDMEIDASVMQQEILMQNGMLAYKVYPQGYNDGEYDKSGNSFSCPFCLRGEDYKGFVTTKMNIFRSHLSLYHPGQVKTAYRPWRKNGGNNNRKGRGKFNVG